MTSKCDLASQNIKVAILNEYDFVETGDHFEGSPILSDKHSNLLVETERDMIFADHLDTHFSAEAFIFCSRHKSASGKPALLVHSTGNLNEGADFGGSSRELSMSIGSLTRVALRRMFQERNEGGLNEFDVSLEVTHHGPTSMNTPMLFVELGSDEDYWTHKEGALAVARSAIDCLSAPIKDTAVIGFGGTHYASKFNRMVLQENAAIGHIAPKYALDNIDASVISQMVTRAAEEVRLALIDWKGTNSVQRNTILPILEELAIETERI